MPLPPYCKFTDVMPPELPKKLPPRRQTDHQIELVPRSRTPAQAPYWMTPPELIELRKLLTELLNAGLVQPSKTPSEHRCCFRRSKMERFGCVWTTGH